jgi:hypothetical protein
MPNRLIDLTGQTFGKWTVRAVGFAVLAAREQRASGVPVHDTMEVRHA